MQEYNESFESIEEDIIEWHLYLFLIVKKKKLYQENYYYYPIILFPRL